MKRLKNRAMSALIIAGALIVGLCLYAIRLADNGQAWASFRSNRHAYNQGMLDTGTVTDRNGVVLAHASNGVYYYADDSLIRTACLHAVGDYAGNIGTGALSAFAGKILGYDFINGLYSRSAGENTLALTIDSALNAAAFNALAGRKGAVLVCNYKTGEVLCMVSSPSYDPNGAPDLSSSYYDGVYINRSISSVYTPGSVFKTVTLTAAIEKIDDLYTRTFYCAGSAVVDGTPVVCSGVHGTQSIEQAFANSCNCAFSELSVELGPEVLAQYAQALGLCSQHSLNGIMTAAGSFEKAESGSVDLAWSGIGQYSDLVSPYALLRVMCAAASGGVLYEPTIIAGERTGRTALLSSGTAEELASMLSYNVTYAYGEAKFPGLDISAKSGTAETGDGTSHAWFSGYIANAGYPLAFVVIVENGGSGLSVAGAVANTVLQAAVKR